MKIHLRSLCPSLLYLYFVNDNQFCFDLKLCTFLKSMRPSTFFLKGSILKEIFTLMRITLENNSFAKKVSIVSWCFPIIILFDLKKAYQHL